jgi:hypothetical protein
LGGLFQLAPDFGGQNRRDDPLPGLNAEFHARLDLDRRRQL